MKKKSKKNASRPKKKTVAKKAKAGAPKKSAALKAKKQISGDKFNSFRKILAQKREDILNTVKNKEKDITLGEIGDELDVANQTFEREMIFELTNSERVVLDDIEAALRKIEKGTYSVCESCAKKIPSPRLKAMPWARLCIECQSKLEVRPRF